MKIQNISSNNTLVPLTYVTADGKTISTNLGPGEFIYTDSPADTKSLIVLTKKGIIKTSPENKPDNFNYFEVYSKDAQPSASSVSQTPAVEADPLDKYKGQFKIPIITKPLVPIVPPPPVIKEETVADIKPSIQEQIITLQETPIVSEQPPKNKGGRPKGSKDTVKRGAPKLKKPAGRPINTEALHGKTKEDVITKCKSRGYDVRITNEDGKAYIITRDLRLDRVELQIENGIVIKANIG